MPYALHPHVHAVAVDEDLVLLDTLADRYLCLPGAGGDWPCGQAASFGEGIWRALAGQGLAIETATASERPPSITLPVRDVVDLAPSPPTARDLCNLALAYVDVLVGYRPPGFADVLRRVRRAGPPRQDAMTPELLRLCGVFHALAVWAPVTGKCLERSFLLLRFLQRSGADAQWMFGVRIWPFRAHCWLQVDDVALDDAAERLAAYTPILST